MAFGATGLALVAYETNVLNSLELGTVDARFAVRGHERPPSNVVLVEVDARTFSELPLQWPFPRAVHARVIEDIAREHPRVIAYDVQFSEGSTCPVSANGSQPPPGKCPQAVSDETALLSALNNAEGRTVMVATETTRRGGMRFLGNVEGNAMLSEVGSHPGSALLPTEPGYALRRVGYSADGLKTFAVVSAEVAEGHRIDARKFGGSSAWIDYYGPENTLNRVPFSEVYLGHQPRGFFHDKIVVVGPSAPTLQDLHPTSTARQMPGAEVQASAIETVLRGLPLRSSAAWLDLALIVLMGCAAPLASLRLGPIATIALALALAAAFTVAVQVAFEDGRVMSFVYPLGALIFSAAGALSVQLVTVAFERERVRDLFSRFVPENVVGEVLASAEDGLRLGGAEREATVMFTDLRGFTSFAETLTPDRVIDLLNHYLSEMSDAILDHGGTLVAYMGDGIMAVFGAPIAQDDHADRALSTAREMLTVRLPRFNAWIREQQLGEGFRMGIGLNSGHVMSGNVGSERRVEYTAVGDTTNTAARIEALTKGTPYQLMLSGATKDALRVPPDDLVYVEDVELRGRRSATAIWSFANDGFEPAEGGAQAVGTPAPQADDSPSQPAASG
ncbi:MAG TPA: adenylate/guanylate cyclase domain-containing protein [Solirubrobacteraceae bacterium]|nr:adenylate/guanylate cyclase domain-containing protein [Solirubrobacteraceae bacterium]